MSSFIVLARYVPSKWRAYRIGKDLTYITSTYGMVPLDEPDIKKNIKAAWFNDELHAEVRKTAVPGSEGTSFHQDGDTSGVDMDFGMVLWSNKEPTEIKLSSGKVVTPKRFELVYFNNLDVHHRRPPHFEGRRWSFRQRVERWNP